MRSIDAIKPLSSDQPDTAHPIHPVQQPATAGSVGGRHSGGRTDVLGPRHLVVALARRLEIPASDHVFEAALSFVDVDQVGDDSYNVSLLTAKPCSNSCASFLRLSDLPRLIPR